MSSTVLLNQRLTTPGTLAVFLDGFFSLMECIKHGRLAGDLS